MKKENQIKNILKTIISIEPPTVSIGQNHYVAYTRSLTGDWKKRYNKDERVRIANCGINRGGQNGTFLTAKKVPVLYLFHKYSIYINIQYQYHPQVR